MKKRYLVQLTVIGLVTISFMIGSHFLYHNIILAWNKHQLEDLAARSIIRTELATDLAVTTIVEIQTKGLTNCSPQVITAYRNYVMSIGSIKDIRLRSSGKTCAVFKADNLKNDLNNSNIWETSRNSTIRLAVQKQGNGQALSVLWKGDAHDIVTVVSTGGLLYDMVPADLRPYLKMHVTLGNGKEIAVYSPTRTGYGNPTPTGDMDGNKIRFSASSGRYPIQSYLTIDRAAISAWNKNSTLKINIIAFLVGLIVGFLAWRTLFPPNGAIEEIDEAIANGEFVPFFQPIVNLGSSEIAGFEMLARWFKPGGEMVSPCRFIPLAENFGRIDGILFSLLRSTGMQIGAELRNNPDLKLTFNVTPEQFLDTSFLPRLLEVIKLAKLPAGNMVAEITERQQLADLEVASQTIAEYKKHGIGIAIDDAGTGHNGLSSIQKLDVCTLKLDKIFIDGIVDNERARQMVELLSNLARQYKMNVVAEGIESSQQAAAALAMGIQEGQGFYFSRPIPGKELLSLLDEQRQPLAQNNIPRQIRKFSARKLRIAS